MYHLKPGVKRDPIRRWALPDRIFFGFGACAILAGVYLRQAPLPGFRAERIIPATGYLGNHIFVTDGLVSFDYHGYALRDRLVEHFSAGWRAQYQERWSCRVETVTFDLLSKRALNQRKMLGPCQYLKDPVPRAKRFLDRFEHAARYRAAARPSSKPAQGQGRNGRPENDPAKYPVISLE